MINIGARFDDRVTGRLTAFSPGSKKIHIDIDPSSINKNVRVDVPIVGDVAHVLEDMIRLWKAKQAQPEREGARRRGGSRSRAGARATACATSTRDNDRSSRNTRSSGSIAAIKDKDVYITTEVGQHQMWAAQFLKFEKPNHWMTSGGLGTMGYGLPAAIGVQIAHPDALVIDVAGEASILMNIQEMSTAAQYRLPVKVFILNNQYMGMVRQWQELLHGGRYSESYMESLPDFVKLAEAFGARRPARRRSPASSTTSIQEMIAVKQPVIVDVRVDQTENCFPMIPSGAAHNEMLLGPEDEAEAGLRRGHGAGLRHWREAADDRAPHDRRAGRQRAGRAGARHRPVLRPRLQHREPDRRRGRSPTEHLSRITIVTSGTPMIIEQIKAQLDRLVPVHKVQRPDRRGPARRARAGADQGARAPARSASSRCASPTSSAPGWSTPRPSPSSSR